MRVLGKFLICILSILLLVACQEKRFEEDIRNIIPDIKAESVEQTDEKLTISYKKGALDISQINSYLRTLMNDYDYKITKQASKKGDDTTFSLSNKKGKTISFIIYENGKVDIEYKVES